MLKNLIHVYYSNTHQFSIFSEFIVQIRALRLVIIDYLSYFIERLGSVE